MLLCIFGDRTPRILYHIPPRQGSEHILCEAKHASGVLIERFEVAYLPIN
jgi:hypothetical protein